MSDMDEFYDRCYEEWRRGHNPDHLSIDTFDHYLSRGCEPEDISVDMLCPHKPKDSEDQQ